MLAPRRWGLGRRPRARGKKARDPSSSSCHSYRTRGYTRGHAPHSREQQVPPRARGSSSQPPTPLEADVPYSGLRKGGLLHKHSRQHATKTQCWSSCKDPPFPTPPACPPASTSATSTASTTCLPHLPPTLLPPPRPARLLSYSLPAYTTRRGGPVPGGLLLPRPALLLKSQQRTSRP